MQLLPSGDPSTWGHKEVQTLISNATNIALAIIGGLAIIYLIVGAYGYFTAFGSEEKANKAKQTITWAIIGVIVVILAKVIVAEVWNIVSSSKPTF